MATFSIPKGFKFDPTDEELIVCYLYRKIMDKSLKWEWMTEKELYGAEPSVVFNDIDDSSPYWTAREEGGCIKRTIYVFTKVIKTSPNSKRNSRRAGSGTWTGQTGPKNIIDSQNGDVIGCTRMLTYQHSKKGGSNDLNHWIMHEYSLIDAGVAAIGERKNDIVLCKITKFVKDSARRHMQLQVQPAQPYFPAATEGNNRGVEGGEEAQGYFLMAAGVEGGEVAQGYFPVATGVEGGEEAQVYFPVAAGVEGEDLAQGYFPVAAGVEGGEEMQGYFPVAEAGNKRDLEGGEESGGKKQRVEVGSLTEERGNTQQTSEMESTVELTPEEMEEEISRLLNFEYESVVDDNMPLFFQ